MGPGSFKKTHLKHSSSVVVPALVFLNHAQLSSALYQN